MLTPPSLNSELALLTTPRPQFTITTVEDQRGALQGRIELHYLGIPSFIDADGLSGGLVVTSYKTRTHPLHAPTVMADVRVGRYVRDNQTGDWCILTRNDRDKLTRLQYVCVRNSVTRERICLTCSSALFDTGDIFASVLFQCHDREYRTCQSCSTGFCSCHRPLVPMRVTGLEDAAISVIADGSTSWRGTVRVTVLNKENADGMHDLDACMDVTSSYEANMDTALASEMQRLAIREKVNSNMSIPAPLTPSQDNSTPDEAFNTLKSDNLPIPQIDATTPDLFDYDSVFSHDSFEIADHFLIPPPPLPEVLDEEDAMLPADPSVLPGGIEMCLDGFDINDMEDVCSFVNSDADTLSTCTHSSTLSNAGSDCPPLPASVPPPCSPEQTKAEVETVSSPVSQGEAAEQKDVLDNLDIVLPIAMPVTTIMSAQPIAMKPLRLTTTTEPLFVSAPVPVTQPLQLSSNQVKPENTALHLAPQPEQGVDDPLLALHAPRLAPRPAGLNFADGFVWQMGAYAGNQMAVAARLEGMEKERKAEERRKKNRQAAARSNARKKDLMDGIKAQIRHSRTRAQQLKTKEMVLREENRLLMEQMQG